MAAEKRASLTWRKNRSNRTRRDGFTQRRKDSRKDSTIRCLPRKGPLVCGSAWTLWLSVNLKPLDFTLCFR